MVQCRIWPKVHVVDQFDSKTVVTITFVLGKKGLNSTRSQNAKTYATTSEIFFYMQLVFTFLSYTLFNHESIYSMSSEIHLGLDWFDTYKNIGTNDTVQCGYFLIRLQSNDILVRSKSNRRKKYTYLFFSRFYALDPYQNLL